jgi:hypothetical protein
VAVAGPAVADAFAAAPTVKSPLLTKDAVPVATVWDAPQACASAAAPAVPQRWPARSRHVPLLSITATDPPAPDANWAIPVKTTRLRGKAGRRNRIGLSPRVIVPLLSRLTVAVPTVAVAAW